MVLFIYIWPKMSRQGLTKGQEFAILQLIGNVQSLGVFSVGWQ